MRRRWGRVAGAIAVPLVLLSTGSARAGADEAVPLVEAVPVRCDGPASCVIDVDVPLPAGIVVPGDEQRPGNRVRIVLPPGYAGDNGAEHPLLVLLHGVGDGSETWTQNTDVEELVVELCAANRERCPIVVTPDGGGKHSEPGWYTDWHDGSRQWETFHTAVVIPWLSEHVAVGGCRESTMVAGLSMGGFGAFSYAGRHPDLFVAAASFSGFLDIRSAPPVSAVGFGVANQFGLGAPTEEMFGPAGLLIEQDGWAEHNPTDLARAGAYDVYEGNLWLATGTGTAGGPAGDQLDNPGSYGIEGFIFAMNQSFRVAMAQAGSTFRDQSYVGGNHGWPYWQHALRAALPDMLSVVEPCAASLAGENVPAGGGHQPASVAAALDAASSPPAVTGQALPATGLAVPLSLATALMLMAIALRATAARAR